jgi:DNA-binding CsgD family transcriptional regulator
MLMRYGLTGVLTRRQEQVIRLLAEGLTLDRAAAELGISADTVRSHFDRARFDIKLHEARQARER